MYTEHDMELIIAERDRRHREEREEWQKEREVLQKELDRKYGTLASLDAQIADIHSVLAELRTLASNEPTEYVTIPKALVEKIWKICDSTPDER